MKLSSLLQAIKNSKVTSFDHFKQAFSKIVALVEKSFMTVHFLPCINSFIHLPAKGFNHLHQMSYFFLLETQELKQLIIAHFSNAGTIKVESAMIQRKFRSLLEKIQILEDSTQRRSNTSNTVRNLFLAVLKQMRYLELFLLCSITLQKSCLEFVEKLRESFKAFLVFEDEIGSTFIENFQPYVFLVSDLEKYLGKSPHEEPYPVPQLYGRQHWAIKAIFSICLEQRTDFQLNFLPIFVIFLEDDIACEPRLKEETHIDHSLSQCWLW